MDKKHHGPTLESFLEEMGTLEETDEWVSKRLFAEQLKDAMQRMKVSTSEMARRMGTSRSAVSRLLDPESSGVTLDSLIRASAAVGMRLEPRLVEIGASGRTGRRAPRPSRRAPVPVSPRKAGAR
jgi:hypothetical protein